MATAPQIRDLIAQTTTGTAQAAQLLLMLA